MNALPSDSAQPQRRVVAVRRSGTYAALVSLVLASLAVALPSQTASGSPTELPAIDSLLSRWRASDLALADGTSVETWPDLAGGVLLSQASTARRPVYRSSVAALGGQPAVEFNRNLAQSLEGSVASGAVPPGYLANAGGVTVFVVLTTPSAMSTAQTAFFASTGSSTSLARIMSQVTNTAQAAISARRLDSDALVTVNSPASALGTDSPHLSTGLMDFAGNQGRQYVDGAWKFAKTLSGSGSLPATGSQRVVIGANGSDANAMDAKIAEVLVYRAALTPAQRAAVDTYIQDTYGIAVSDYQTSTPTTTTTSPAPSPTTPTTPPTTSSSTTTSTTTAPVTNAAKVSVTSSTIAPKTSLSPGQSASLGVVAKDGSGNALPRATVYLKFQATAGGGTAAVGSVPLTGSYQPFVVDDVGRLTVTYRAPATLPAGGKDLLTAANRSSSATSTASASYSFTTTAHWRWAPEPIAAPGSLPPNTHTLTRVTALDDAWQPVPFAQICLMLTRTAGGGSATIPGLSLTSKYQCTKGDQTGTATIDYLTPAVLPSTGMDVLNVRDTTSSVYNTSSFHGYSFGQLTNVSLNPSPLAASGTLAPGAKVTVTVLPRDATGAVVAGATVALWLESSTGARGTVGSYAASDSGATLTSVPQDYTTHTKTTMTVTYQVPRSLPGSGTDRLMARVVSADGTITTTTVSQYSYAH